MKKEVLGVMKKEVRFSIVGIDDLPLAPMRHAPDHPDIIMNVVGRDLETNEWVYSYIVPQAIIDAEETKTIRYQFNKYWVHDLLRVQISTRLDPQSNFIVYISETREELMKYMEQRADKKQWVHNGRGEFHNQRTHEIIFHIGPHSSVIAGRGFKAYILGHSVL